MQINVIHTRYGKAAILAGISTLAVMVSGSAMAQQTAANAPEEIVVTAQRKSERLQNVPISITAATPARLEKSSITDMRDLTQLAPGLRITGNGANISPSIRGIKGDQTDPGNDAAVSLYVDGVLQPDQLGNTADIADIERVEVLKGPQGTLFGRNTSGGAIRIFTRGPDLYETNGQFEVGYGNRNQLVGNAFLSTPLVEDKLAGSISVHYKRRDSYSYDVIRQANGRDANETVVRTKLLAQVSDDFKIDIMGSYMRKFDADAVAYTALNGNSINRIFVPGAVIPSTPFTYASQDPSTLKANIYNGSIKLTWDSDFGTFTSQSSIFASKSFYSNDADAAEGDVLSYPVFKWEKNFQQEVIYNSPKFGDFEVTAGASYYKDDARYDPVTLQGAFIAFPFTSGGFGVPAVHGYFKQDIESYGVFGEVTYTPTDRLTLLGGLRFSHESRTAQGGYYLTAVRPTDYSTGAYLQGAFTPVTWEDVTFRASVRYQVTDAGDNVYFTFSQGFKSGGFNVSGMQGTAYDPEELNAYEIGFKTDSSRMISANIAAFYYDYSNQQVSANVNNTNITLNAASSEIYGAEAEITARLTDEFTVNAGLAWLESKYKSYPGAVGNDLSGGPLCRCGNTTVVFDASGRRVPTTPKFTASLVASYEKELDAGTVAMSASYFYTDSFNRYSFGRLKTHAYSTLGLRASFQPAGSGFTFYAWGKNITDTKYEDSFLVTAAADAVKYGEPASYGAGFKYDF